MQNNLSKKTQFLIGGGFISNLILEKEWENTAIGPIEHWPQSLKSTLSLMLRSKSPMFLFWGPDCICFFNDDAIPNINEKNISKILGEKGSVAFGADWEVSYTTLEKIIKNEVDAILDDEPRVIIGADFKETYWRFHHHSFHNEEGEVAGVLCTGFDITPQIQTKRESAKTEEKLNLVIEASELGIYEIDLTNDTGVYSNRYLEIFGFKDSPYKNHSQWTTHLVPEDLSIRNNSHKEALKTGILKYTARFTHIDGSLKYIQINGKVIYDDKKVPKKLMGTLRDITEERKYQKQLEDSEQKFRLLADSMPQFVWTADADGNVYYFNKALYHYTGLSEEEVSENGWAQFVHPDDREENIKRWMESVVSGEDYLFEQRFIRYDGEARWQLSRAIPKKGNNGEIEMWVGTSTDIHDIRELDEQKDYFISMASHELKTPITSIKGYVQLLQNKYKNHPDPLIHKALTVVDKQIITLTTLITDLLDVSKIKSGGLQLHKSYHEINDVINQAIEEIYQINPKYNFECTLTNNIQVFIDRENIRQVLINFLTNAVKYSPNTRKIKIESVIEDHHLTVSVTDSGIGISAENHEKIFDRFYRVEGKNEKTFPGFGIGLFIAAEIIKKHGGKIGVISEVGKGSTFYFKLPIKDNL